MLSAQNNVRNKKHCEIWNLVRQIQSQKSQKNAGAHRIIKPIRRARAEITVQWLQK